MAGVKISFDWNKPVKKIVDEATGGDRTALFAAQNWHRLYDPWVPMNTGMLAHGQVDHYVENGTGIIHHKAPYAARQYNGTNFNFSKEKHLLASAQWDRAAKQAGKAAQLAREIQAFMKRGG